MGVFRSGKHLRVRINGGVHRCESVRVRDTTEEFETTNSESDRAGSEDTLTLFYESEDTGVTMCEVTIVGKYDLGAAPLTVWRHNQLLTGLYVYINGIDADPYIFPEFRVLEFEIDPSVRGAEGVPFRLRGKNHGAYTRPAL